LFLKFFESHQFGNSTRENDQTILYIVAKNFTPENHVFQPQNVREKMMLWKPLFIRLPEHQKRLQQKIS